MSEFLSIKNWEKYQPLRGRGGWIKDYTQQDDEPELAKLTMFQRGVYQELRRIRGRRGKNTPNDIEFILSAMSAPLKDRPRIPHAIRELVACGLLVITNQELDAAKTGENKSKEENKKESKEKPSAPAPPRGVVNNSRIAKMTGDVRHNRMREMIKLWYQEWASHECPWDGSEAKQLDSMLKSTPNWMDSQYVGCLVNLSLSECIPKGDRPREWLGKLPKFLHGPLDQWWKPKGAANGNGQISKAQQRHERNNDKYDRAIGKLSSGAGGNLPLGDDGRGTRALPGEPELLPPPRGKTGWPPPNGSSA